MGQAVTLPGQLDAIRGGQTALNQSSKGILETSTNIRNLLPVIDAAAAASQRGTDIQVGATRLKSEEEARAYEFESGQYREQARTIRTAAAQAEAKRSRDLVSSIETIQAIQAGRGVGGGSPTTRAVLENLRSDTRGDIQTERSDYLNKAAASELLAGRAGEKGRYSLLAGDYGVEAARAEGAGRQAGFRAQKIDTDIRLSENALRLIENDFRRAELRSKKTAAQAGAIDSTLNLFGKFAGK